MGSLCLLLCKKLGGFFLTLLVVFVCLGQGFPWSFSL